MCEETLCLTCFLSSSLLVTDYSPLMIYMRRNAIGGISVRHDQRYIDENSNYDHVWERFVPVTNIRNGYEFAFDEVNETIYWAQVKGYLPDLTPAVRDYVLHRDRRHRCFFIVVRNSSHQFRWYE